MSLYMLGFPDEAKDSCQQVTSRNRRITSMDDELSGDLKNTSVLRLLIFLRSWTHLLPTLQFMSKITCWDVIHNV